MIKTHAVIVASLLGLSACGGSSGFKTKAFDGVFKDSNVSGLRYVSGAKEGVTDASGGFQYEDDKSVSFSIGGVELGSGLGKSVMTPLDLVENGSFASDEVINIVRFLIMLDENNKPSDGIVISSKVQEKAKSWGLVDFASDNFPTADVNSIVVDASVEDGLSHALPDIATASAHLKTTLLCSSSGAFVGTYIGTEKGNFAFVVDPVEGDVKGSTFKESGEAPVEVVMTTGVDYSNDFAFVSAEALAKSFTGKLTSSDDMSGAWVDSASEDNKGDFSGERLGGESDAVYRYTVVYKSDGGNKQGLYTFDIDKNNRVKGTSYDVASKQESELSGKITDNKLTVETEGGTKLTGFIVEDTLAITGVWISGDQQSNGSFTGGGCRLN